jgi:hypothetical protein
MRERAEVMERFRELRSVRLKARKAEFLSKTPRNCQHNERLRVKGEGMCGFCQNPIVLQRIKNKVFVCNQDDTASRCRVFECRSTEESVEEDFEEVLRSPARVGNDYPKLALLIWFLQNWESPSRAGRLKEAWVSMLRSSFRFLFMKWW